MGTEVLWTDDPRRALETTGTFLAGDPVRHNVILTLLHRRVAHPEPARYWTVLLDGQPAGFVFQSPLNFVATLTPMPDEAVAAVVHSIVDAGVVLPGVNGEAAVAARFAGQWTESKRSSAWPVQGQRIYEVRHVVTPRAIAGQLRRAAPADRQLLIAWFRGFQAEIGEGTRDPAQVVDRELAKGVLWLWDDGGPMALAGTSEPVVGVVRISAVYTPAQHRNCGYASSCVAAVSEQVLACGFRCILYTDLGNATSNSIYRSIGYRAVTEVLRYRFA
jgi:predicted GNAT family acetyltransferase